MRFNKSSLVALAIASLASAPVMAQAAANTVADRATAESNDESKALGVGASGIIFALALAAGIAALIIASDSDLDEPVSP